MPPILPALAPQSCDTNIGALDAPRGRGAAVRAGAASDRARPRGRALPVPPPCADDRPAAAVVLLLQTAGAGPAAVPLPAACARSLLPSEPVRTGQARSALAARRSGRAPGRGDARARAQAA